MPQSVSNKALLDFHARMEWEGGLEGVVRYGVDDTGDAILNEICEEMDALVDRWDARWKKLYSIYPDLFEEEEDAAPF